MKLCTRVDCTCMAAAKSSGSMTLEQDGYDVKDFENSLLEVFILKRKNGTKVVKTSDIPKDGKFNFGSDYWVDQDMFYWNGHYEADIKDLEYFGKIDCEYLISITESGKLRELEPGVWCLYEAESRGESVGEWWSQKLKTQVPILEALLLRAEKCEKLIRISRIMMTGEMFKEEQDNIYNLLFLLLKSKNTLWRLEAVTAIVKWSVLPFYPLKSEYTIKFLRELVGLDAKDACDTILQLLHHRDRNVRAEAASTLRQLHYFDLADIDARLRAAEKCDSLDIIHDLDVYIVPNPNVRSKKELWQEAIQNLRNFKDPSTIPAIEEFIRRIIDKYKICVCGCCFFGAGRDVKDLILKAREAITYIRMNMQQKSDVSDEARGAIIQKPH